MRDYCKGRLIGANWAKKQLMLLQQGREGRASLLSQCGEGGKGKRRDLATSSLN